MEDWSTKRFIFYVLAMVFVIGLIGALIIKSGSAKTGIGVLPDETAEAENCTEAMYVRTSKYQTLEKYPIYKVCVKDILGNGEEKTEDTEDIPEEEKKDILHYGYTEKEIDLLALTVMAEAESEPEYGQRLVIDTVLNRVDDKRFPDNVHDVVYQKSQYTGVTGSRINKCYVRDDFRELVMDEMKNRSNYEVLYFRTNHYHNFGTPLFQVGGHYFSK